MNNGFAPSSTVLSVLPGRKPILTDSQQTEGYLPSIQLQHITTNITLVTLTATNTSNHRCLWLIQWIQNVCNMFHLKILEFSNVTLIYEGNMYLQSVWNHSPKYIVTPGTISTPNYNSIHFIQIHQIHYKTKRPTGYRISHNTLYQTL